MVLLRNSDEYDHLVELDPPSGYYDDYKQNVEHCEPQVNGKFSKLDGTFACIFRENGQLFVRVGSEQIMVEEHTTAELQTSRASILKLRKRLNTLIIRQGQEIALKFQYRPPKLDWVDHYMMWEDPFIELDHFDFGLYIANILQDPRRRDRIFDSSTD